MNQKQLFESLSAYKAELEGLGLKIVQEWVNNEPAVVVRLASFSNGGIVFFADKVGYRDQFCDQLIPLLSGTFFQLAKAKGCFACGNYWFSELVTTRFRDIQQILIKGKYESLYWNHQTLVLQGRHM